MDENKKTDGKDVLEEKKNVLVLSKKISFEGKEYTEIDLSSLEDLATKDLIQARRLMNMGNSGLEYYPERTHEFACYVASIKTGHPYEMLTSLCARDGMQLRSMVQSFLY